LAKMRGALALMLRSIAAQMGAQTRPPPRLRCDASRSMRAMSWRLHPSRRAHAHSTLPSRWSTRPPQDEDSRARGSSPNRFSVIPVSRCQTATLVPATHVCAGFCNFASLTPNEGWAERRETFGCSAEHPWGVSCASKTRVNALMTRYARRLARRLASHNAGRSPLGAPP
jgi:hypothetical protein